MYALYLGNDFCKQVSCGNLFFEQKETIFKRGSLFYFLVVIEVQMKIYKVMIPDSSTY